MACVALAAMSTRPANTTATLMATSHRNNSKRKITVAMAGPKFRGTQMREKLLSEMIEKKVEEAWRVCERNRWSDECRVAWDEVEEITRAKADLRLRLLEDGRDPLESFCLHNPDADECRPAVTDDA